MKSGSHISANSAVWREAGKVGNMIAASRPLAPVRILLVDDFEPWRDAVCSILKCRADYVIVGQVADGLEAVLKAQELKPDLILLDIGLPSLDGLQAAIQIRQLVPSAKIIFLTQNADADVARAAMNGGAHAYLVKIDAGSELQPAIEAVLRGDQFVSGCLGAVS